jgi:hypothetical protein
VLALKLRRRELRSAEQRRWQHGRSQEACFDLPGRGTEGDGVVARGGINFSGVDVLDWSI